MAGKALVRLVVSRTIVVSPEGVAVIREVTEQREIETRDVCLFCAHHRLCMAMRNEMRSFVLPCVVS